MARPDRPDTTALAHALGQAVIGKHGIEVKLIDLRGVVSYTDYFVVCTGQNARLTKAIGEHVVDHMVKEGHGKPQRRETDPEGTWLLLDYVDVVLHIFTPESRAFYRLESLWGQVPQESLEEEAPQAAGSLEQRQAT